MSQPYKTTRLVEFRHTDAAGIVHFSTFFDWMEEVEHEFIRRLGFSVFMKDDEGTISWPRVHTSCDFHSPIRFEDTVDIEILLEKFGTSSIHYRFHFSCKGQEVADGKMIATCCRVGLGDRPRAIPLPETIASKLRPLL
ncbi:MAG: 4-hydroxybenzoyl-CoA thioesterase [Planctomycetaceae bacterium]|nr:4-hydroxybenzoyl-CoA thioesterase [Planctomycetaceae bacterium]MBP62205.1 4-hydroxybenzoyl-CoA thioesterase [Planctomycetaceae bacterium]